MTLGYSQPFALSPSPHLYPPDPLSRPARPARPSSVSPRVPGSAPPSPPPRTLWPIWGLLPGLSLFTPLPVLAAPKSHLPPPKTRWQEPRRPRIVNAWTEEVEELPWSSTPSGGSPDVSRLPRAATLLPGSGRSHHLESSAVQDLEPATPAPSSSIIGKLGWKWPSWGALRRAKEKTRAVAPASETVSELQ